MEDLIIKRKDLVANELSLIDAFPGSKMWHKYRAAKAAREEFDREHPEVAAAEKAEAEKREAERNAAFAANPEKIWNM